jgi:hypothetical protein
MCAVDREIVANSRLIIDFSFIKSSVFQFLVGPAKASFYIHTELAGRHSQPLSRLMQGEMMEAKQGVAHLEDITEDVFWCFTQYLYTGNYKSLLVEVEPAAPSPIISSKDVPPTPPIEESQPAPEVFPINEARPLDEPFTFDERVPGEPVPDPESFPVDEPHSPDDVTWGWGLARPVAKPKKKKKRRQPDGDPGHCRGVKGAALWEKFQDGAEYSELDQCNLRSLKVSEIDYLCHARVYIFADRYDIPKLRELAVNKLHFFLAMSDLDQSRVAHVVDLMRYTFENTMDQTSGIDMLRDVVSEYAVCQIEKLAKDSDFCNLLQENGDVGKDLVPRMVKRLD